MKSAAGIIAIPLWVFGIVLAKGFWSTLFAVLFPLWAWYLSIEFFATKYLF